MRLNSTALLFALMLIGSTTSWSQTIRQFTVDDGLPSSHVYEVKQDSKGFYWIATSEGLVRYDGYKFEQVGEGNSPFNRDIWWSFEDNEGKMWGLGHGTRLWNWDGSEFSHLDVPFEGFDESTVFVRQFQDEHDRQWLTLGRHFFGIKGSDTIHLDIPKYLSLQKPVAHPLLYQDTHGSSFIITLNPVTVWSIDEDGELHEYLKYSTHLNHGILTSNANEKNEGNTTTIVRSQDSIFSINNGLMTSYINGVETEETDFPSSNLFTEKSHRVIKLRDKYAFILKNRNFITDLDFNHLKEFDIIRNLNINTVYQDHESSVWISTSDQGLIYFTKDALAARTYSETEAQRSEVIAIESDSKGHVWIAYKNGMVCKLIDGQLQCRELRSTHAMDKSWYIHNFLLVEDHMALVVGDFELLHSPVDKFLSTDGEHDQLLELSGLKRLNVGLDGTLYVTDYWKSFQLVFRENGPPEQTILGDRKILATTRDGEGRLLVSSFQGLYLQDQNGDTSLLSSSVLANKFVSNRTELFVLDKNRGAYQFFEDSLSPIEQLTSYLVKDLSFEGDSVLWAATNSGAVQLSKNQTTGTYDLMRKMTVATGLATNDVTAIKTDAKNIYVGTAKGFTVISRSMLKGETQNSDVQITGIRASNKKLNVQDHYTIAPYDNALQFEFVYVSPRSAGQITYHYKLDGVDKTWHSTKETSVFYPFIPAGSHRFRLKAVDIDSTPSKSEVMIDIHIKQYWYKTTWFLLLAVLSSITITALLFRWRTRLKHQRELEQTDMNKRLADLKLNALRSQMNPHFVFNVLNSIQESFINDDIRVANKHLSDFSKLMRLFLETSNDKHNQLDKEIQILTHYIDLERMRLKNQFEYEFRIDEEIDTEEVFIPSMLLQPIIENAILHGLRYKEGTGNLTITIRQGKDGTLSVIVEDDGIGRKRSAEINAKRKGSHKSMASTIIHERVELLNSGGTDQITMSIEDLTDEGSACGTRVSLNISLEMNN